MRVAMAINWNLGASSLTNIARNNFREIGKIMNETKSFTLAAIGIQSVGLGDFNQHYDLLHIPNMGGYKFALNAASCCDNVIFGASGIDEIIYGKEILVWPGSWPQVKKQMAKEISYWKKYSDKIFPKLYKEFMVFEKKYKLNRVRKHTMFPTAFSIIGKK